LAKARATHRSKRAREDDLTPGHVHAPAMGGDAPAGVPGPDGRPLAGGPDPEGARHGRRLIHWSRRSAALALERILDSRALLERAEALCREADQKLVASELTFWLAADRASPLPIVGLRLEPPDDRASDAIPGPA